MKRKLLLAVCLLLVNSLFANELSDLLNYNSLKDFEFHYIQKSCLDVLASGKRDTIKKYYPDIEKQTFYLEAKDEFVQWYEQDCYSNIFIAPYYRNGHDIIGIGNDKLGPEWGLTFLIEQYEQKNNYWYLTCYDIIDTENMKNAFHYRKNWPVKEDNCVIIIKVDGDYIDVYINDLDHHYDTFCKVNDLTLISYNYLIKKDVDDLRLVTWPRHADGSCDYDGSSKAKKNGVVDKKSAVVSTLRQAQGPQAQPPHPHHPPTSLLKNS